MQCRFSPRNEKLFIVWLQPAFLILLLAPWTNPIFPPPWPSSVISYHLTILSFPSFLLFFKNTLTYRKVSSYCSGSCVAPPRPLFRKERFKPSRLLEVVSGGILRVFLSDSFPGALRASLVKVVPPSQRQPMSNGQWRGTKTQLKFAVES